MGPYRPAGISRRKASKCPIRPPSAAPTPSSASPFMNTASNNQLRTMLSDELGHQLTQLPIHITNSIIIIRTLRLELLSIVVCSGYSETGDLKPSFPPCPSWSWGTGLWAGARFHLILFSTLDTPKLPCPLTIAKVSTVVACETFKLVYRNKVVTIMNSQHRHSLSNHVVPSTLSRVQSPKESRACVSAASHI